MRKLAATVAATGLLTGGNFSRGLDVKTRTQAVARARELMLL
jgi:hypothetical protein